MKVFRLSTLLYIALLLALVACQPITRQPEKLPATAVEQKPAIMLTTFSPTTFRPPMSISFGVEWSVAEEYADVFTITYTGHDAGLSFMNVKNATVAGPDAIPFPDDFITWIKSPNSLFKIVASKPIVVGGVKGTQIDATATCGNKTGWINLSGTGWKCPNGEQINFIALDDISGERVLIQIQGSPSGEDYRFIVEEAQKVLDTVVFPKPTTTFSPKLVKTPLSVSFGVDWQVDYDLPAKFGIWNPHDFGLAFYIVTTAQLADPLDGHLIPFPADFLAWTKSNPDFVAVTSAPTTVAGIEGVQIDATPIWKSTTTHLKLFLSLSGDPLGNMHGQPDGENIVNDPEQWRFILLDDVHGERMLIILIVGNGHKFEDAVEQSQKVLDTVVFVKP